MSNGMDNMSLEIQDNGVRLMGRSWLEPSQSGSPT